MTKVEEHFELYRQLRAELIDAERDRRAGMVAVKTAQAAVEDAARRVRSLHKRLLEAAAPIPQLLGSDISGVTGGIVDGAAAQPLGAS